MVTLHAPGLTGTTTKVTVLVIVMTMSMIVQMLSFTPLSTHAPQHYQKGLNCFFRPLRKMNENYNFEGKGKNGMFHVSFSIVQRKSTPKIKGGKFYSHPVVVSSGCHNIKTDWLSQIKKLDIHSSGASKIKVLAG